MRRSLIAPIVLLVSIAGAALAAPDIVGFEDQASSSLTQAPARAERIAPYRPRFGRTQPVIAIVGENAGTELTDFVIPHGILARADVAELVAVGMHAGPLTMRPALQIRPDMAAAAFDRRYPQGADYLIVPAVVRRDDPALLAWISAQAAKGGVIVSICDGALVVANAGLLKGHRATAHWATRDLRQERYPDVRWVENARYVADGNIVSSAGISAAIPTSLALVEAIAGTAKAAEVGRQVGTPNWRGPHNSEIFHPKIGRNLSGFAATYVVNPWFHPPEKIGIPIAGGADEIALALTADAYTRSGRGKAHALATAPGLVTTSQGLMVVPDGPAQKESVDRTVALPRLGSRPPLEAVLASIAKDYGGATAFGVALAFEYPGVRG